MKLSEIKYFIKWKLNLKWNLLEPNPMLLWIRL